jgi:hypothetical protein
MVVTAKQLVAARTSQSAYPEWVLGLLLDDLELG